MKKHTGRNNLGKEKAVMIASSVLILGALTVTGIYVRKEDQKAEDNGYSIDLESLEQSAEEIPEEELIIVGDDDLDVDPDLYQEYREANSGDVQNPDLARGTQEEVTPTPMQEDAQEKTDEDEPQQEKVTGTQDAAESMSSMTVAEIIQEKTDALVFDTSEALAWPVVGNVIMNYSMDSYVYYATLGQYRYSDAIVISATEGEHITAAADGVVTEVFYDEEIGNALTIALGSGYELTYGQLADIQVAAGDTVSRGELLGTVAAPTKYYTLEGTNVYFRMTKDGEPVNPLTLLQ